MSDKSWNWTYVKRATQREKLLMLEMIRSENEFQQQEPHGVDADDNDVPITFRLENHNGYQAQAYGPDGVMLDTSFSECFVRCGNCKKIFTWNGSDSFICWHCFAEYEG